MDKAIIVDEEIHKAIKIKAAEEGITMQALLKKTFMEE